MRTDMGMVDLDADDDAPQAQGNSPGHLRDLAAAGYARAPEATAADARRWAWPLRRRGDRLSAPLIAGAASSPAALCAGLV